ncbi:transcription initiation factor TFIID subunit 12-like isoform X1 [Amphibalanus amphitrite]|uniref:transcription initiation factor TFIID subunit 12-like isoform X1 n=1 Tax=Amphibalanus amphitrite TaxID=1232801 RepID=UPI001C914CAF|nr:transcription initiation factor TFIID subunit 12-like isoform X1 [Amphibalanus amphitrite]
MAQPQASLTAGAALVSLSGAQTATGTVNMNVQPTYVTLAPGQQLIGHSPQPSAVLAGTLVAKPPGMAALAAPTVQQSVVTLQQPQVQPTQSQPAAAAAPQQQRQSAGAAAAASAAATGDLLTKQRLHELVKEVDPNEQLDEEVEELLLQLADDFIESTVSTACQLAKHRKAATVDVKDVQLYLERKWNMWIPGFGTEEIRPYKRSGATEAHKQRMAIIRKALKKY